MFNYCSGLSNHKSLCCNAPIFLFPLFFDSETAQQVYHILVFRWTAAALGLCRDASLSLVCRKNNNKWYGFKIIFQICMNKVYWTLHQHSSVCVYSQDWLCVSAVVSARDSMRVVTVGLEQLGGKKTTFAAGLLWPASSSAGPATQTIQHIFNI